MPFFIRQPHRSRRDPYARERSRRSTVWFNFVPIWIHSARRRGISSSSHGCHNWHSTDLSDGNHFKLSWKILESMWLFFDDRIFLTKSCGASRRASHGRTQTRRVSAACQFLAIVSQLAPEINTEPKSEDAKECAYNRDFDWGHRRHKKFSLSFDCTQRGPKWKSNSARGCGIRGYVIKRPVKRYGPYLRRLRLICCLYGTAPCSTSNLYAVGSIVRRTNSNDDRAQSP